MKKKIFIYWVPFACAAGILGGCGAKVQLPEDAVCYEQGINQAEGYLYLQYGNKVYVPYCPYEPEYQGECIGYCDIPEEEGVEASRVYIYELKGYSSDEWIIESPALSVCDEGMVYREINTTNIPEGLESEYEWNR